MTLRRTPLKRRSAKKRAERGDAQPVVDEVFARDRGCILRDAGDVAGPCFGHLTPHHLRKEKQGGTWSLANLVVLCAGHNGWVEDHPQKAFRLGLVIFEGWTSAWAWSQMRIKGLPVAGRGRRCTGEGTALPPLHRGPVATCPACGAVVTAVRRIDDQKPAVGRHDLEGVA